MSELLHKLQKAVEDKWITKRDHSTLPISIYTYSKRTEIENNWNDITKICRGLIVDNSGNIIANPFPKFFNIGEQSKEKVCGTKLLKHSLGEFYIPEGNYKVLSKEDGSLIIVCVYQGQLVVASKGSFESEQAKIAKKFIEDKYNKTKFDYNYTYLFELIYKEGRIVVDYKDEEALYLLGIRSNSGVDMSYDYCEFFANKFNFKQAKIYNKTIEECLDEINIPYDNREGYVIHFDDGNKLKIKFQAYMQLHKIMTDITSKDILESIERGESIIDFCTDKNVPDEMIDEIKAVEREFITDYENLEDQAKSYVLEAQKIENQKEQALYVMNNVPKKINGIVFAMLRGKEYDKYIFTILKNQEKENRKFIGTCAK